MQPMRRERKPGDSGNAKSVEKKRWPNARLAGLTARPWVAGHSELNSC